MKRRALVLALTFGGLLLAGTAAAQEPTAEDLARKSQNPVSDLISLPFQNNTNFGIGPNDRTQNVLYIQPVLPTSVSSKWNIVSRAIVPLIYQPDVAQAEGGEFGLGDISYTAFLSPAQPGKLIWGVGPVVLLPTATADALGTDKWGLGPSIVVLTMPSPWVIGVLANNVWSIAGADDAADVNQLLVQYFINYNLPNGWYLTSSPIITANWEAPSGEEWLVPFGAGAGKIFRAGKLPLNANVSAYWKAIHPDELPYPDWTLRVQVAALFPK